MALPAGASLPQSERIFGKYELISKLATGGMAEIFLARRIDDPTGATVVIKRVLPHLEEEERFVDMFRDEARLASQIEHENVCRVFEAGVTNHRNFIAMEFLSGIPLSTVLTKIARERSTMGFRIVASILTQACEGLHAAHELKDGEGELVHLVHRDMTPSNIFITNKGIVKILDFGVAKAHGASQKTRTGTLKGKNAYMSPEQILTSNLDRRSDLFSLGVVFWESLTAKRLFSRHSDFLTFRAITEDDVPRVDKFRSDCPSSIVGIVQKALEKKPENRYTTALELKASIAYAMEDHGGIASKEELMVFLERNFPKELGENQGLVGTVSTLASLSSPITLPLQAPVELLEEMPTVKNFHHDSDFDLAPSRMESEAFDFEKTTESSTFDQTVDSEGRKGRGLFLGVTALVAILALGWFGYRGFGGDKGIVNAERLKESLTDASDPFAGKTDPFKGGVTHRKPDFIETKSALASNTENTIEKQAFNEKELKTQNSFTPTSQPVNELAREMTEEPKQKSVESNDILKNSLEGETKNNEESNGLKFVQSDVDVSEKHIKEVQEKQEKTDGGKDDLAKDVKNPEKPNVKKADKTKKGPGFYSIDTIPYSIIYVDGKRVGETPLFKIKIPSGTHRIKAITSNGKTRTWKAKIVEGRHLNKGSVLLK